MNFYKDVIEHRGNLLIRGIHDGKEFKEKINFKPTLFSITQKNTGHTNLQGQKLNPITFNSIPNAREFK